jgi:hypothetical protein
MIWFFKQERISFAFYYFCYFIIRNIWNNYNWLRIPRNKAWHIISIQLSAINYLLLFLGWKYQKRKWAIVKTSSGNYFVIEFWFNSAWLIFAEDAGFLTVFFFSEIYLKSSKKNRIVKRIMMQRNKLKS